MGAHASAAMWISSNSSNSESSTGWWTCCPALIRFALNSWVTVLPSDYRGRTHVLPDSRSCSASSIRNDSNDIAATVDTANEADTSSSPALAAASAPNVAQTSISNFELLAVIGRGGYGKVGAEVSAGLLDSLRCEPD